MSAEVEEAVQPLDLASCDDVAAVRDAARAWVQATNDARAQEMAALRDEASALRDRLQELADQLEALSAQEAALLSRPSPQSEVEDTVGAALLEGIRRAMDRLEDRQEEMLLALSEREAEVEQQLAHDPELGPVCAEVAAFDAKALGAHLPATYLAVLHEHHEARVRRLDAWRAARLRVPLDLDAEPITPEVIVAIRAVPGQPQLARVVLPMRAGASAPDTPQAALGDALASLCSEELRAMVRDGGQVPVAPRFGEDAGLLVLEATLPARLDGSLGEELCTRLTSRFDTSEVLRRAKVAARPTLVPAAWLVAARRAASPRPASQPVRDAPDAADAPDALQSV
ncbi:MAG: hypothetical protein H6733_16725 [Alphaproteobacteria bacterium]|nr:hypothetical protein [Alphaproteobacteria bacterium]